MRNTSNGACTDVEIPVAMMVKQIVGLMNAAGYDVATVGSSSRRAANVGDQEMKKQMKTFIILLFNGL